MVGDVIIVLLALNNIIDALGTQENSLSRVDKKDFFDKETSTAKKVKRWAPGLQDIALDYPELDDAYAENQLEFARPFSSSPGSTLYYRPAPRRPSGAVTRTVFSPPSGFIPRVFAAAKAAIATLTGPQTVLSRTTYLPPPRPGITALHVPQVPATDSGTPSTNAAAAAAAAAAAVAAVTRSIYEAAGQRGHGFYEKDSYPPPTTYNNYGIWPEPSRSPWTTLQPPEITFRIPYDGWGDRGRPQVTDTYGPPPPMWSKQNQNPTITIDASSHPWSENHYSKVLYNRDGWTNFRNNWNDYNQNRGWFQNRLKDIWLDDTVMRNSYGRSPGGYAAATADSPPNGDSFADAKVTANGASAVAATVWDLSGALAGRGHGSKRTKTEIRYDQAKDDFSREGKTLEEEREQLSGVNPFLGKTEDLDADNESDKNPSKCNGDDKCSLPKTNVERLRALFPSRRKS